MSPSGEIVEGSSVTLTCSSDANPAANYTWYKENEDSPKASGQIFIISDIRAEHSGSYYCEAQNKNGRHNATVNLTVVSGKSCWSTKKLSVLLPHHVNQECYYVNQLNRHTAVQAAFMHYSALCTTTVDLKKKQTNKKSRCDWNVDFQLKFRVFQENMGFTISCRIPPLSGAPKYLDKLT